MEKPCGHLFADARRAGDEHAAVGWRDALDLLAQLIDGVGCADEIILAAGAQFERLVLAPEPRGLDRALDNEQQPVRLERLLDEIISADFDRRDRGFDIAVAADHDDRQLRQFALHDLQYLEPVELAALQPNIEDDERGLARADRVERLAAIARLPRLVAFVAENAAHQAADIGFVIDDKNVVRHALRFHLHAWPLVGGFHLDAMEHELDASAAARAILEHQFAVVVFHDLLDDRKAQSG